MKEKLEVKLEIAKKMLSGMDIKTVVSLTELEVEDVEKLKDSGI